MVQRADVAQHAHLRVLAHRAGVDDDDVRGELVVRKAEAHLGEVAAQALAVALVLLAAVGVHQRQRRPALRGEAFAQGRGDRLLRFDLPVFDFLSLICHFRKTHFNSNCTYTVIVPYPVLLRRHIAVPALSSPARIRRSSGMCTSCPRV